MKKSRRIAVMALMVALTTIFSFVPVSITGVPIGLMILPLLVVSQIEDLKMTISLGIWLGIINLIAWYTTKAGTVLAPVFQNPVICIVPRVLIGIVAHLINKGLKKLFLKPELPLAAQYGIEEAIVTVSTTCGVLTNTGFVSLFTLLFFNNKTLSNGTAINVNYLLGWFGVGFLIEIIAFPILNGPIVLALRKAKLVYDPTKNDKKKKQNKDILVEGKE